MSLFQFIPTASHKEDLNFAKTRIWIYLLPIRFSTDFSNLSILSESLENIPFISSISCQKQGEKKCQRF